MSSRRPIAAALVVLTCAFAAGCASQGDGGGTAGKVQVTATTTQLGDFVRQVGGRRVEVRQILEPNSDPHEYEPRPSDARAVADARLVFRSGGDVDAWLSDVVDAAGGHARTIDVSRAVQARGEDPHWWQDPRNAVRAVGAIRAALVRADPDGRAQYGRRAAAYVARLRRLDRSVASCIAKLPPERRRLVTSHDALGYYAARYGLRVVGALIPSLSTQAQPSSRDTDRLVRQIREQGVRAIFPESSLNPRLERAVSRETGARVGGALWADTLGPGGSSGETYVGSIVSNTEAIVRGLSGGTVSCRPSA